MLHHSDHAAAPAASGISAADAVATEAADHVIITSSGADASWDTTVLQQIEKHLAYHVGPLAKLLVAQGATQVANRQALCHMLATNIPNERERHLFLTKVLATLPAIATPDTAAPGADEAVPTAVTWDPIRLQRLTEHLVNYLGPVGKLLVRREAKRAKDLAELQGLLAAHITTEADKQRFLHDVTAR
jgi:serine/threonine-protein kinase